MKKTMIWFVFFFVTLTFSSQIEQHKVTVRNVTVPVRVYDKNKFVDSLTIDDFELYEDGIIQKIEALHLTDKTQLSRTEGAKGFIPQLSRNYYLLFQIIDHNPKLKEAIDYFFSEVMLPQDNLTIMTPVKSYTLPSDALEKYSREEISKEMYEILRRDVKIGSSNYNSVFRDLKRIAQSIAGSDDTEIESGFSIEILLSRYRESLQNMEELRRVDEKWFLMFAQQLKRLSGQKNVFFFYQREFRPEISGNVYNLIQSGYQGKPDILSQANELFAFYRRESSWDANRIKQAFADSSIDFYFLFMDRRPESALGITMREQSEDVFHTFLEVTKATGGLIRTSQNPAAGFKNAVNSSEGCYFLFYSPKNYRQDGKFKKISIKIKNKGYTIKYRTGYYAH